MDRLASAIFYNFWKVLTAICSLGEWLLLVFVCGVHLPAVGHVLLVIALYAFNYAATGWCERELHHAPVVNRLGKTTIAVGFGSFLSASLLALGAAAWVGWQLLVPAARAATVPGPDLWTGFDAVAKGAVTGGFVLVLWGYLVGPHWTRLTRRPIPIMNLPGEFEGYTIAHLSDLHLGPLADRATIAAALDLVSTLRVDLVCITGDIIDSPYADLDSWIPELNRLRARDGVVAILGNHDRDSGPDRIATAIARHTSIHLLRDDITMIRRGERALAIIGLEDRRPPHCAAALSALIDATPAEAVPILLAHHPNVFPDATSADVPLTLAGHTHAGQLAIPGFRHLNVSHVLVTPYDVGWFRTETHRMHVSAGLGSSGQPLRIGTRPEITIVTLTRTSLDGGDLPSSR